VLDRPPELHSASKVSHSWLIISHGHQPNNKIRQQQQREAKNDDRWSQIYCRGPLQTQLLSLSPWCQMNYKKRIRKYFSWCEIGGVHWGHISWLRQRWWWKWRTCQRRCTWCWLWWLCYDGLYCRALQLSKCSYSTAILLGEKQFTRFL
jgi:hypothetical protein